MSNLHPSPKLTQKWITDLKVKFKTLKILENNIGENLSGLGFIDDFLDILPKTLPMKEGTDKLDSIKILKMCSAKDSQ